jgi:hypothetical protein
VTQETDPTGADLISRTRVLADRLADLIDQYPSEDPDITPVALAQLSVAGAEVGTVPLLPGQVDWLAELLAAETATCRNAHTGQSGQCGHCAGTGSPRAPRTAPPSGTIWREDRRS